ncbi:hypothetical protein MNEG_5206 [Monoraphidium neglectum]|uniref:Uncharacterized protein n=1 Tax=Monoraphidium neglectum TaxID=145388 RepID=A0A0D2NB89_9CHLO|nr:hypothetical protein MNEG_5206 [Monoraphidium neglectum]KIZ02756.1 hypothetical protein MNEG_5206 [Monoraphidium neglectum]|eukprot:XP_013901775.1 hypothetical protein MNEG_5206 [Monoraphidium neglectum]
MDVESVTSAIHSRIEALRSLKATLVKQAADAVKSCCPPPDAAPTRRGDQDARQQQRRARPRGASDERADPSHTPDGAGAGRGAGAQLPVEGFGKVWEVLSKPVRCGDGDAAEPAGPAPRASLLDAAALEAYKQHAAAHAALLPPAAARHAEELPTLVARALPAGWGMFGRGLDESLDAASAAAAEPLPSPQAGAEHHAAPPRALLRSQHERLHLLLAGALPACRAAAAAAGDGEGVAAGEGAGAAPSLVLLPLAEEEEADADPPDVDLPSYLSRLTLHHPGPRPKPAPALVSSKAEIRGGGGAAPATLRGQPSRLDGRGAAASDTRELLAADGFGAAQGPAAAGIGAAAGGPMAAPGAASVDPAGAAPPMQHADPWRAVGAAGGAAGSAAAAAAECLEALLGLGGADEGGGCSLEIEDDEGALRGADVMSQGADVSPPQQQQQQQRQQQQRQQQQQQQQRASHGEREAVAPSPAVGGSADDIATEADRGEGVSPRVGAEAAAAGGDAYALLAATGRYDAPMPMLAAEPPATNSSVAAADAGGVPEAPEAADQIMDWDAPEEIELEEHAWRLAAASRPAWKPVARAEVLLVPQHQAPQRLPPQVRAPRSAHS